MGLEGRLEGVVAEQKVIDGELYDGVRGPATWARKPGPPSCDGDIFQFYVRRTEQPNRYINMRICTHVDLELQISGFQGGVLSDVNQTEPVSGPPYVLGPGRYNLVATMP